MINNQVADTTRPLQMNELTEEKIETHLGDSGFVLGQWHYVSVITYHNVQGVFEF